MELQENRGAGPVIDGYSQGESFRINQKTYDSSVLVQAEKSVADWPPRSVADIDEAALALLVALKPQLVLLGTGTDMAFLEPALLEIFYTNNIGVEMMTTKAACRTYNLLMAEGREVVAALLI